MVRHVGPGAENEKHNRSNCENHLNVECCKGNLEEPHGQPWEIETDYESSILAHLSWWWTRFSREFTIKDQVLCDHAFMEKELQCSLPGLLT